MKRPYYLFNPGRMSRKDNTLKFVPIDEDGNEGQPKYLPIESVETLLVFGSLDANSSLYNFLGKQQISVHFFDYYEHYTGSFMPKEYLLAGKMQIAQTQLYLNKTKRIELAQLIIEGAAANMLKNLKYYNNRGKAAEETIMQIETLLPSIKTTKYVDELMGIEGNIRMAYYKAFEIIINDFTMGNRQKMPPSNEVNAMISFGNMLCYTACLDAIYHTQLNPTISFLHEPGYRRFSLCLDISEIFKPILVDRLIFRLLNKKEIQANNFEKELNSCLLKETGRKKFVQAWDEKMKETIEHRSLKRHVSYKKLIQLECYKISKHILGIETYKPFKAWW
jgi:CRISP-associated protein Cas1